MSRDGGWSHVDRRPLPEGLVSRKLCRVGSAAICVSTLRKVSEALPGRCCWQSPARRSTSSGSLTSANVSAPCGVTLRSSRRLPKRINCICCRAASGARPSDSTTSVGNQANPVGALRRVIQTTAKKIASTIAKLPTTVATARLPVGGRLVAGAAAAVRGLS